MVVFFCLQETATDLQEFSKHFSNLVAYCNKLLPYQMLRCVSPLHLYCEGDVQLDLNSVAKFCTASTIGRVQ